MNQLLLALAAATAFLIWPRRFSFRSVRDIRRRFRARIDRHKRTSRAAIRAELLADAEVAQASPSRPARKGRARPQPLRGAAVVGDERSSALILEHAPVMLTLRRLVTPQDDGFRIDRGQDLLLRYYANSIAHFFEQPARPRAAAS